MITLEKIRPAIRWRIDYCNFKTAQLSGRVLNNLKPRVLPQEQLVTAFRQEKLAAIIAMPNGNKMFSWALHDNDGRGTSFQDYSPDKFRQWLEWYRFPHFIWRSPSDPILKDMNRKIRRRGRQTWSTLFSRYTIPQLDWHDRYSLPDVYYITSALGRIPQRVLDVGAGWGRLGMAWAALGARWIGMSDSIEQPYFLQNQYLSSIPLVSFSESVGNGARVDYSRPGILHLPTWELGKIPEKSVEAISAIQVLREVSADFIDYFFEQVRRLLVPGGIFYHRDNDPMLRKDSAHNVDVIKLLDQLGFKLVLSTALVQGRDIHGLPRAYVLER